MNAAPLSRLFSWMDTVAREGRRRGRVPPPGQHPRRGRPLGRTAAKRKDARPLSPEMGDDVRFAVVRPVEPDAFPESVAESLCSGESTFVEREVRTFRGSLWMDRRSELSSFLREFKFLPCGDDGRHRR